MRTPSRTYLLIRELLGFALVLLGIAAFALALLALYQRRWFIEGGLTFLIGWITLAAGIRLLKVTLAARALGDEEAASDRRPPKRR